MISTVGAAVFATGVLVVVFDLLRHYRITSKGTIGNLWGAGTLEWLPNDTYGIRSMPVVTGRPTSISSTIAHQEIELGPVA